MKCETAYRRFQDSVLEQNRVHISGRVLNIGSGRFGSNSLSDTVICVDLYTENPVGTKISADVTADATKPLPFVEGAFDCVLCLNLLEHVRDPRAVVENAHAALKPHGKLIISVPFMHHYHADPADYWRFTQQGIAELLADKFSIVKIEPIGGRFLYFHNFLDFHGMPALLSRLIFPATCFLTAREHRKEKWATGFFAIAEKAGADKK